MLAHNTFIVSAKSVYYSTKISGLAKIFIINVNVHKGVDHISY